MIQLLKGDCLHTLKTLPDNSVDAIVTDPPYGLSFMGKSWDYEVPKADIWKEALRVLKPGGHMLAFFGTRTYHRGVVNIEDAGFEIRDQIMWIYGSGFPKSHNIKEGEFQGWGTALKPANEPIVVARKPLEKGLTVAENILKYGTGAINIDASRIKTEDNLGRKVLQTQSWKNTSTAGVGSVTDDWKMGRWPANIILDEEAAMALDEQSGECKSAGKYKDKTLEKSIGLNSVFGVGDRRPTAYAGETGGASRFFYVAKASKAERNKGLEGMPLHDTYSEAAATPMRDKREQTQSANNHPTVKPIKLMSYLIKLVTPPNGTVLDPFMGSGSTGVAAKELGFNFIGCEMNKEYFEIAQKRIND